MTVTVRNARHTALAMRQYCPLMGFG
jgi:hypothetical protein